MSLRIFGLSWVILLLTTICACSNIGEKRTLLAAAGFKTFPATTPTQLSKLHRLKPGKLTAFTGKSGTVYIFADTAKSSLIVGGPAQLQKYRILKAKQQRIDENLLDAQVNMDNADWSAWGPDSGFGFGVASNPD